MFVIALESMVRYLSLISFALILLLSGCGAGLYNSAPAYVPMFTNKTEAGGNIFIGPDGVNGNVGLGFLNYFGVYGGGHAVFSVNSSFPLISSNKASNAYAYVGILGRHQTKLGKDFLLLKEILFDYGIGNGKYQDNSYSQDYWSIIDQSLYNPLNAQINLAIKWRGLALGFALKNVFLNFKTYSSKYNHGVNNFFFNSQPDLSHSFMQYAFEPNLFFRAGGESAAFFINFRWVNFYFKDSMQDYSYTFDNHLNNSFYENVQISLGIQFNIVDFD